MIQDITFFESIQNHDFCIDHYAGNYQHIHPYAWLLLTCGDVDVERCIPYEYTFYLNEYPAHYNSNKGITVATP